MHGQPTAAWNDVDLVMDCLRGNKDAWDAIVDRYKDLVYSEPLKYQLSSQEAADIFQEVWVELYSELQNLLSPGALRIWLRSVSVHKCHVWRLSQRTDPALPELTAIA